MKQHAERSKNSKRFPSEILDQMHDIQSKKTDLFKETYHSNKDFQRARSKGIQDLYLQCYRIVVQWIP